MGLAPSHQMFESINLSGLGQRSMTLTIGSHMYSCTYCTISQFIGFNSFYKIFHLSSFPYKSIREQSWPCCKVGQGQLRIMIWTNFVGPRVPNAVYQVSRSSAFLFWRRRFLKGFYHIWAWQPTWSCDQDHLNQLSFPHDAPHEIWLWLAQWFWRRYLKMVDEGWTDNGAFLYYELTHKPKGSGELKINH